MKICILTSSYPVSSEITIGGIASFERDVAIELIKHGSLVHVIAPKQPGNDFKDENLQIHRFSWFRSHKGLELSSLKFSKFLDFISIISIIVMGLVAVFKLNSKYKFDITFAMWAVPAGL